MFPRLEAYQALVHNTIDRRSGFFVPGVDGYFESAVGEKVSKKVLQAIKIYSEYEEGIEAAEYDYECSCDKFHATELEDMIAWGKAYKEKTEDRINGELIKAVQIGDIDGVKSAIVSGANVKYVAVSMVLMRAVNIGYYDIVKVLINPEVDNDFYVSNKTALSCAVYNGYTDIVEVLINAGADINFKDESNKTALICAAYSGYTDIVKALINAGADTSIKDRLNRTALICAAYHGYTDIVEVLINAGADASIKDKHNMTALMYANSKNYFDIVCLSMMNLIK